VKGRKGRPKLPNIAPPDNAHTWSGGGWFGSTENLARFCLELERCGSAVEAAASCGVSLSHARIRKSQSPEFSRMWDQAIAAFRLGGGQVRKPRQATDEVCAAFVAALEDVGLATTAAARIGADLRELYLRRKNDGDFRQAWEEAQELYVDRLEAEAYRRGVEGWEEPVFHNGVQVGAIRKYSDQLLVAQLKGRRPRVYRERVDVEQNLQVSGGVLVVGAVADTADKWLAEHGQKRLGSSDDESNGP